MFTIDLESGERRSSFTSDIQRFARLGDALPNLDFVMSMGNPVDVPPPELYIHEFIQMLHGSSKPMIITADSRKDLEAIWRIAVAVAGDEETLRQKPFFLTYLEPVSPLRMTRDPVQKLLFMAEKGLPSNFAPACNMGAGGPVTMAGAIALNNAECLLGLVLSQLKNRGTPFLYAGNVSSLDMRTTVVSYGAPEWSLSMAALTDMARRYGLPVWGYAGSSDSKTVDAQAGAEAALSIYTAFLSRCTIVHDVGYIEMGYTSSMEMLVLADEIIAMVRYILDGVPVSDRTLAREVIDQVQPGAGFLAEEHTLENWRAAQFIPRILNRQRHSQWVEKGSVEMRAALNQQARRLLDSHPPVPLSSELEREIETVLQQFRQG
jgi:trimethylamine--corrinoid protein Co-methyltransferase